MAPHKNLLFNCFISQIIHLSVLSASIRNYSDVFLENLYRQWLTQH
jgi:hypothetical protein